MISEKEHQFSESLTRVYSFLECNHVYTKMTRSTVLIIPIQSINSGPVITHFQYSNNNKNNSSCKTLIKIYNRTCISTRNYLKERKQEVA